MEFQLLKGRFTEEEAKFLNPLVLALIGDAVYEVFIRTYIVSENKTMNVHKIHIKTVAHVKAKAQSKYMKHIIEYLNEDEMAIFKRGRNTKSNVPKNADIGEYRWATGFEALIGYLYILNKEERLDYLLNEIIKVGV